MIMIACECHAHAMDAACLPGPAGSFATGGAESGSKEELAPLALLCGVRVEAWLTFPAAKNSGAEAAGGLAGAGAEAEHAVGATEEHAEEELLVACHRIHPLVFAL